MSSWTPPWNDLDAANAIQVYLQSASSSRRRPRTMLTPSLMRPVRNSTYRDLGPRSKPQGGLWTASWHEGGSAWADLLADDWNEYGTFRGFLLQPINPRIYMIDSVPALHRLLSQFGRVSDPETGNSWKVIDFERAARVYDAIRLTKSGFEAIRYLWYGSPEWYAIESWDLPSTLWMRWKFGRPIPISVRRPQ